jgi:transglutaminase-like putative cysteine protease
MLADLRRADPEGYKHEVVLHEGLGHWMKNQERSALPFLQSATRDPLPKKVIWKQDDVTHQRLYWLALSRENQKAGTLIIARRDGQTIHLDAAEGVSSVTILLNDDMLDLDKPVIVRLGDRELFNGTLQRSDALVRSSLAVAHDPALCFSAAVEVKTSPISQQPNPRVAPVAAAGEPQPDWLATVPAELLEEYTGLTNVDEKSEDWRPVLTPIASEIIKDSQSIPEAVKALNRDLFKRVNVQYHPSKRPKPNQSPSESMEAGFASCTGLSILLVDACRSVGIPARLVGTPAWANKKGDASGNHAGNHTWVEIWDGQCWRYLGASEESNLDDTWFTGNTKLANPDVFANGIYAAATVRDSALYFPMVWNPRNQSIPAVDVSAYYAHRTQVTFSMPASSTVRLRDNGRLVGLIKGQPDGTAITLPLAGGRLYTAEIVEADGKKSSTSFTLGLAEKQDVSLKATQAK